MSLIGVRKAFQASGVKQELSVKELEQLLRLVGYDPTSAEVEDLIKQAGGWNENMTFGQFKHYESSHRLHVRGSMEANGGVTDGEMNRYKQYFRRNCDASGKFMTPKAMRELLGELFPDTRLNKDRHVRIAQIVEEADSDGNGLFDFSEYIGLIQKAAEELDADSMVKGLKLKTQLKFTNAEIKQFR